MTREKKKLLRTAILEKRNALTQNEILEAVRLILDNLKNVKSFNDAKDIFCYFSFRSEVPTQAIIEQYWQQQKNVYIPVCVPETMEMVIARYTADTELVTVTYGLQEPAPDSLRIADRNLLDLALVPGAVFDARGYRIGYGAGYYDKFFSLSKKTIYKIALAYSFQIVEEVPRDKFDVPVDCIVTEKGIIYCGDNK